MKNKEKWKIRKHWKVIFYKCSWCCSSYETELQIVIIATNVYQPVGFTNANSVAMAYLKLSIVTQLVLRLHLSFCLSICWMDEWEMSQSEYESERPFSWWHWPYNGSGNLFAFFWKQLFWSCVQIDVWWDDCLVLMWPSLCWVYPSLDWILAPAYDENLFITLFALAGL